MRDLKQLETILVAAQDRVQEEVSALLAANFTLSLEDYSVREKTDAIELLKGKQICSQLELVGDSSATGCLLIGIKDGIRLGGTLIMLPDSELSEYIGREEYSEEIEDSYGEVANIIAGAYTQEFEDSYGSACRFIRKEQGLVVPAKIEIDTAEPVPNQPLLVVICKMVLDDTPMGSLVAFLQADFFGLDGDVVATTADGQAEETSTPEPESAETGKEPEKTVSTSAFKGDPVKNQERIDELLGESRITLEEEMSALTGASIKLGEARNRLLTRDGLFEECAVSNQVIADLDIAGDAEGLSHLVVATRDAVHLGGVLIMLPTSELESAAAKEDFNDDLNDAYGEIANIGAGVYTAVFGEKFRKKLRFIRKEWKTVEVHDQAAVEAGTVAEGNYYVSSISVMANDLQLGDMHMMIPAGVLDIAVPEKEAAADLKEPQETPEKNREDTSIPDPGQEAKPAVAGQSPADLAKHQGRVDTLLAACKDKMEEEMGALLGLEVRLADGVSEAIDKAGFVEKQIDKKQVVANLDVRGDTEGEAFLTIDLSDAIRLGGTLIMLPASELDKVIADEEFGEDTDDAYGEIANIITGVYSKIFEEQYTKKIRFVKTDLKVVDPSDVAVASDEPFPDQAYYMSSMDLYLGDTAYGKVQFLVPLSLLDLQGLDAPEEVERQAEADGKSPSAGSSPAAAETYQQNGLSSLQDTADIDVLLVGDNQIEAEKIEKQLANLGYVAKYLSYKDELQNYLPGSVKAVYLVGQTIDEMAFGTAVKLSTLCNVPIVAAGPGWTRSKVIKAVKYGVVDILLTPATNADIVENLKNNLMQLAA